MGLPFPCFGVSKVFSSIFLVLFSIDFTQPYNFKYHLYAVDFHIYSSIPNLYFELQTACLAPFKCLPGIPNSMKTILNSYFPLLNMLLFQASSSHQQMPLIRTLFFILITLISSLVSLFLLYSTFDQWRKHVGSSSNVSQTQLCTFSFVTILVQVTIISLGLLKLPLTEIIISALYAHSHLNILHKAQPQQFFQNEVTSGY